MRAGLLMTLISSCLTLLLLLMLLAITPGEAAATKTKSKQPSKTPAVTAEHVSARANHHHHHHTAERGTSSMTDEEADDKERRVRKRSKWIQQQSTSSIAAQSSMMSNKDGSFIKRIVTEVIAERDAQIAAALFEVAKNQPHLQMMVQTLGELSQSNQRLELSSTRLDETQRRLDSRLGVISEKMTLLESRLSQTERRIEREMTHIHGKMDEVFRNMPDKPTDVMVRGVKQIQDHLNVIEEILLDRSGSSNNNQIRGKSTRHSKSNHHGISSSELHKLGNSLSQAIAAVHLDLGRIVRETESNLDHQLNMLSTDNGLFSCAISRLMDLLPPSGTTSGVPHRVTAAASAEELLLMTPPLLLDGSGVSNSSSSTRRQLLEGNSIQTVDLSSGAVDIDQLANTNISSSTKCVLKCP